MARRITITGDSSQFRQDFERTAASIGSQLERLGAKSNNLNLNGNQRVGYLNQQARGADIVGQRRDAQQNVREFERIQAANRRDYDEEYQRISNGRGKNKQSKLENLRSNYNTQNAELTGNIANEQAKVQEMDRLSEALRELSALEREREYAEKSRHNEYRRLSNREIDAKLKDTNKEIKAKRETGGDTDELERDRNELKRLKSQRENEEKGGKNGLTDFLKWQAMVHYVGQGVREVGNAYGDTTGQMAGVGVNAAGAGLVGAVPAAAFGLLGIALNKGRQLEEVSDKLSRSVGYDRKYGFNEETPAEDLTMDAIEFRQRAAQLASARGIGGPNLGHDTLQDMYINRGLGVDDGQLDKMAGFARMGAGTHTDRAILKLVGVLENSGIVKMDPANFDMSALPKYLDKIATLSQIQFERTGRVDKGFSSEIKMLGAITSMGGIFKHEDNATGLIQNMQQRFQNPADDFQRFLTAQSIIKTNPGKYANDPLAIELAMENPQIEHMRSLAMQTYKQSRAAGGKGKFGDWRTVANLATLTGGNKHKALELMNEIESDPNGFMKGGGGAMMSMGAVEKRAKDNSGTLGKYDAGISNTFAKTGEAMIKVIDKTTQAMMGGASLGDIATAVGEVKDAITGNKTAEQNKGTVVQIKSKKGQGKYVRVHGAGSTY